MNNTNLHVYFLTWNISGFKKYLEGVEIPGLDVGTGGGHGSGGEGKHSKGGGKSSSAPRSWTLSSLHNLPKKPDPNVKDGLGRTVLHLVCSSGSDPRSYDFLQVLLAHPHIQVNAQDSESGWTALHRAMWTGNLRAARELLQRADTDLGVKDAEGLTAMDLYNSTCEGTNPEDDAMGTDLFTWGSNKNYTLGLPDPSDRALPERVNLLTQSQAAAQDQQGRDGARTPTSPATKQGKRYDASKFDQTGVREAVMSKWHTAVVTTEGKGNLSLAGFGSNGRLGKTIHSQYALKPHSDNSYTVVSVALGQDHTLALTSAGHVMSWGQNRFSQLGYVIDPPAGGESVHKAFNNARDEELFQTTPRRIIGPLKREVVLGVAASRLSSACWTSDSVWTWGTNSGHLGYEKASNPVQVLPRKATAVSQPVLDLAMTDYALACLMDTNEVLVLHHDAVMKITFPTQRFPSEFMVYRPPAFVSKPTITKITSSGITFAALSSLGDVFTFSLPNPVDMDLGKDGKHYVVKPQMVWALRKRFTAVKDVALGSDGAVIICTHSGHVYVRQRVQKTWSFKRVPFLQRVIKVAANETGSFAAIRSDASPAPFAIHGSTLSEDMLDLLPHMQRFSQTRKRLLAITDRSYDEDDEEADEAVVRDTINVRGLGRTVVDWKATDEDLTLGCDAYVATEGRSIPVHTFMLTQRLVPLKGLWPKATPANSPITISDKDGVPVLDLGKFSLWSVLLLLQYVYSDDLTAIWDSRVQSSLRDYIPGIQLDVIEIRQDLVALAGLFGLDAWQGPLASTGKVAMPPTLRSQLHGFYEEAQQPGTQAQGLCDVVLRLADKDVYAQSLLLRARVPFFDAMYEDRDWTASRGDEDGQGHTVIDLPNLHWKSARLVLKYLHDGVEENIFDYEHQGNLDDFLDFVFEVLSVANEFLLERMVLLCSSVIRRHVAITNASALACEASFYNAQDLKRSIFSYIAFNLETMLENGMLDMMDLRVLYDLASFVQDRQGLRLPVSRSRVLHELAMEKHADWLAEQDIPVARLRAPRQWKIRSPKLSPVVVQTPPKSKKERAVLGSQPSAADASHGLNDEIFSMEDDLPPAVTSATTPRSSLSGPSTTPGAPGSSPWRSKAGDAQKVDLRTIMAETSKAAPATPSPLRHPTSSPQIRQQGSFSGTPTPIRPMGSPSLNVQKEGQWRPSSTNGSPRSVPSASFPSLAQAQARPPPSRGAPSPAQGFTPSFPALNAQAGPSRPKVIVPTRMANPPPRRTSDTAAWAVPTLSTPFPQPASLSPPSAAVSLLSIQESQAKQNRMAAPQARKSLLEIQEQERRDEAARVAEKDFQRWWKEEEARVAREAAQANKAPPKKKSRPRPRGGKGGQGQQGGRGANQGSPAMSTPVG